MTVSTVDDLQPEVLRQLMQLAPMLADMMAESLQRRRLTYARVRLLLVLHEAGCVSMTELSRARDVTPRNVTGLVDRLEAAGLVRRSRHATDRRRTMVDLTPRGRRLCEELLEGRRRLAADVLGSFDVSELAATQRVLGQVHDALEKRRPA